MTPPPPLWGGWRSVTGHYPRGSLRLTHSATVGISRWPRLRLRLYYRRTVRVGSYPHHGEAVIPIDLRQRGTRIRRVMHDGIVRQLRDALAVLSPHAAPPSLGWGTMVPPFGSFTGPSWLESRYIALGISSTCGGRPAGYFTASVVGVGVPGR